MSQVSAQTGPGIGGAHGPGSGTGPLARAVDLSAGYGAEPAIESVSFDIQPGERIGLLGPNGGGKTTLLRSMAGERLRIFGTLVVNARCAVVPQTERSRLDYPVSALDVALMGSLARLPWWRQPGRAERATARDALERVGITDLENATYGELSGGQRQRVLIARGLVQEADLLLLDEPFTGLDATSTQLLEGLLAELLAERRGIVVATHDLEQARRADRVLCINRRQVAFGAPDAVLDPTVLEETYGGAIVRLPGSAAVGILPPYHHDHAR